MIIYNLDTDLDGLAVDRNSDKQVPKLSEPASGNPDTI